MYLKSLNRASDDSSPRNEISRIKQKTRRSLAELQERKEMRCADGSEKRHFDRFIRLSQTNCLLRGKAISYYRKVSSLYKLEVDNDLAI